MAKRTVITGGTLVTDYGTFAGDVQIVGERIVGLATTGSFEQADELIDATGLWVLPEQSGQPDLRLWVRWFECYPYL